MPSENMFLTFSSPIPFSMKMYLTICLDCVDLSFGSMAAVLENVEYGMFLSPYSFKAIFFSTVIYDNFSLDILKSGIVLTL